MSISYMALNRMLEQRVDEDEEFRWLVKQNRKSTLADGRALSDEVLLDKLHSLGVTQASRDWLDQFSRKCPSAQVLATAIIDHGGLEIPEDQMDWVWIALVCLWERWFPDRPNFEMLDDRMQEGYHAYNREDPLETARLWLRTWHDILYLMQTFPIPTLEEFDEWFGGTQSVSTWVQDFSDGLHWAADTEPSFARERIAFCHAILKIAEKTDRNIGWISGFRRDLAEAYADLGESATAEELYTQWMREDPNWGRGWIGWADNYYLAAPKAKRDPAKAEQILKDGLAVPEVKDRVHILERLVILYSETGRGDEAARLREQIATLKAEQSRRHQLRQADDEGNGGRELELDEIIAELDAEYTGKLPEKALRAAQRRRDEITPRLIQLLQQATQNVRDGNVPNRSGHLFALFLLTEFGAKEALPAILEAISLPGEGPFDLFGDAITEELTAILAALAVDSPQVIDVLIENDSINEYVHWAAANTYLHWVRDGRLTREQAIQRLIEHLKHAIAQDDIETVSYLCSELEYYAPAEALSEIEAAFQQGPAEDFVVELNDIRKSISEGDARFRLALKQCPPTGIKDTVAEFRSWAAYREEEPSIGRAQASSGTVRMSEDEAADPLGESAWSPSTTIRNTSPKVGRNDPCPCGSRKKFKKCCGAK